MSLVRTAFQHGPLLKNRGTVSLGWTGRSLLALLALSWVVVTKPPGARAQDDPEGDSTAVDTARVGPPAPAEQSPQAIPTVPVGPSLQQRPPVDRLARSQAADTFDVPAPAASDTGRADRYLPSLPRRDRDLFRDHSPFLGPRSRSDNVQNVALDSTGEQYRIDDDRDGLDTPLRLDAPVYRRQQYQANVRENWTTLVEQRQRQRQAQRGGLGMSMTVPGGSESAFTTIFGKPEVDLRMNGRADVNTGFQYSKNEQQGLRGDPTQLDPDFKQDLQLGITGTIGDKMQINVDWDTENQFDYQNQVKLEYTGYEDDIVQSVEAGNVFLETPSQLISGGQSLFGIKSTFQLGNLNLTTIASQQEGQANSLSIEGGAETTEFDLQATDYDEDSHFFLGYYFRNNWNRTNQDPTRVTLFDGFSRVTDIEVWKLQTSSRRSNEGDVRRVAAVVDLGESAELLQLADEYTTPELPSSARDQYDDSDRATLRDGESDTSVSSYLESGTNLDQPLRSQDWEEGRFKKLEKGRDYELDNRRGFLSLQQRLRSNEALAVAFRYEANGEVHTIGDFSGDRAGSGGGVKADRLVLKLLRPTNPVAPGPNASTKPPTWFLEMRNVYRLGGRGFTSENFDLDIEYNPSGQGAETTLSAISSRPLLQVLGLDRIDENGAQNPDNQIDFTRQRINADTGLLYFPYLEPFGERILEIADENGTASAGAEFAFPNLYVKKKTNAEKEDTEKNVFRIAGSYKGEASGFYDLRAFAGLVDGSVEVTSGGQTLQEGTDYVVDYQSGTVNITNQTYLSEGREINISYEQRSLATLQQKTLLGARADWNLRDRFALGATMMRLSQKSPVDKYRIGEEPVKNTIWGVDGSMELEPQWLTEAVDALPLIDTRADSRLSLSGEFAQLRPGHTTTPAFDRTIERVDDAEEDSYAPDERSGMSYMDDFEGFENTFSLREQLSAWQISAAPDSIAAVPGLEGSAPGSADTGARTHWRGAFGWYQLTQQIRENLRDKVPNPDREEVELLDIREVFPRRDVRGPNSTLHTFDVHFNPWERGPYNYTSNLDDFFRFPERVWGGITRRLPEGYNDFSVQNVESVEFIVKVYPENGPITDGAKLFVDLGTISEDVIPDELLNTEDGLSSSFSADDLDELSRVAGGTQNDALDVQDNTTEDLGLDGLVSYDPGPYESGLQERTFYSEFVERADSTLNAVGGLGLSAVQQRRLETEVARIKEDPSADDYHHYENDRYFGDDQFFWGETSLEQRFSRYYAGHELNGFESQNKLADNVSLRRGISRQPDTEDLDGAGGSVNITNNYFQYGIPLDSLDERAGTDAGPTDYVVNKVGENRDWYKIRIPVREFTKRVGNIQDFSNIESIRLWTTGHEAPVTMRFASMELVGSQWRPSEQVAQQPVARRTVPEVGSGELRVASINTEENPNYDPPVGAVRSRSFTSTGDRRQDREQSLLLNLDELAPGQQRGIFKTFQQGLDLLKYSNLRMYAHVHGQTNAPQEKEKIRENLRMFVRLGANESNDYYEYEQPLEPSNVPGTEGAASLWREENEMNVLLSALSQLKTARDQSGTRPDTTFSSDRLDLPLEFAPEGTTLKIRGTPSLSGVNTVVIGVRHAGNPDASPTPPGLEGVELWVNELRVSGFDEDSGWATTSSADISLADLATLQGSFQRKTDGFGSLSSSLDEREQANNTSWSARAEVNLDALFSQRRNWSIPVTMQVQSSLTAPRFDPERGDVTISELKDQFEILPDSTVENQFGDRYPDQSLDELRSTLQDSVERASQSYNLRRTVTANLSKSNSQSWWVRNTVDGTALNFSYFDRTARSPQRLLNDQWSWSGSADYQLDFGRARTVQPLGFLPDVALLRTLGDVEFNYVPTSLSVTGSAEREVSTTRSRPSVREGEVRPPRVTNPFRDNQRFIHRRNFSLQYDPFAFLSLSFDTNTQQRLDEIGSRTQTNLLFSNHPDAGNTILTDVDTTAFFANPRDYIENLPSDVDGPALRNALNESLFVEERLAPRSEGEVFRDVLFGGARPRTNNYDQRLSATLSVGLLDRQALNWIDLRDISYQSQFNWSNSAKGSLTGASVNNSLTIRTGVSLRPNRVWERFGFFERMKQAQREAERDDQSPPGNRPQPGVDEDSDEDDESEDVEEEEEPTWEDLPLPDPVDLLRQFALMVMDIDDVTVNYNGDRSSRSSNIGTPTTDETGTVTEIATHYKLLEALRGDGPALGYRFGLDRSISANERVFTEGQVIDNLTNQHRFEARTALSPNSSLNIDLNWNLRWTTQSDIEYQRPGDEASPIQRSEDESGSVSTSVWAFGAYQNFFERQLEKLRSNVDAPSRTWDANNVVLSKPGLAEDFRAAYLTGTGSIGPHNFSPFPLPGWNVRYTGFSDWPLVRTITESASLNHAYNATYESSFVSLQTAGDTTRKSAIGQTFLVVEAPFEPRSLRIQEQFQPLIGVDITWPGALQTSLEWNRRITTVLRGADLVDRKTGELSGRLSYSQRGLRLPFLPRLENQIRFSVTLTRSVNDEREFLLSDALEEAQTTLETYDPEDALRDDNVNPLSTTTRFTVTPQVSYTVSNRVTADFSLEYERFEGDSRQPSYTNVNGSFNISVNIAQN